MERPPIATGKQFRTTFTLWSSMPGTIGALLIILYFTAVLDLGSDGWKWFGFGLLGLTSSLTPYGQWLQHRIDHDIARALDRIDAGQQTREDLVRGYVAARLLPQRCMWVHASNYVIAGLFLPVWMRWAIPDVSAFTLAVLTAGSLTGAGACMPFSLWATGRFVSPTRDYFASQLTPTERAEHAPYASLAAKLAMPVVGVTFGTVTFLALLGYSVAINLLEAQDVNLKTRFLEGAHAAYRANPATTRHLRALARDRGIALEFGVVDLTAAPGMPAEGLALSERELAWMRGGEAPAPTSLQLDSDTTFAWLPLGDGRALVAVSPLRAIVPELGSTLLMVGIVLVGLCGVSFAVALRAGSDTRRIAGLLRAQAERVGAGDFTGSGMIESEDELGAVAHAFAKMTETLGGTLTRVVSTAAQMDEAAGALAQIGATLREVTVAQVRGIERANASVAIVNRQASAITTSTQELIGSVEEASSSVLELGAASEQLNQTAIALNTQVEAVGASIDQMVRSVAQAGEASDALNVAVADTNSSVAEMARGVQSVDAHTLETARLSTRVVELADGGRERVQETIRGMEVIRDATDTANRTIGGLAERMQEIGAIVDVIDEIADETNLLALNAAIIAAQAGDQGRAFSVVADEIKDLADRVLTNTKEIGGLIRSVQQESVNAAEAIRQGADRVQSGVDLSAQAGVALEEITDAARHAGDRIQEIVQAMREQTRAASHVEQLSHGVSERVAQIRTSVSEQSRGNEVVMRGSLVMRDVAQQTQRTTEEQAHGALRIRDSIEGVREAVDRIHVALQQQSDSCQSAGISLAEVFDRTHTNDEATDALGAAASSLQQLAEALRNDVQKFRIA